MALLVGLLGLSRSHRTRRMPVIGLNDFLDQPMSHNIPLIEIDKFDTGDILENIAHFDEAGHTIGW